MALEWEMEDKFFCHNMNAHLHIGICFFVPKEIISEIKMSCEHSDCVHSISLL